MPIVIPKEIIDISQTCRICTINSSFMSFINLFDTEIADNVKVCDALANLTNLEVNFYCELYKFANYSINYLRLRPFEDRHRRRLSPSDMCSLPETPRRCISSKVAGIKHSRDDAFAVDKHCCD